jgi:hypothetical protein
MKRIGTVIILLSTLAFAADQKAATTVDSGRFSVMVSGKRVATESFSMQQGAGGNTVSSTLEFDNGTSKASQQSSLEIGSDGSLRKYTWQEVNPGKAKIVAEPQNDNFIVVHQKMNETEAGKDLSHPVSASTTSIVDDNFYSHVQVLLWRYMAGSCQGGQCRYAEQKLPVFVPHQDMAQMFTISYGGEEAVLIKKSMLKASKFKVQTEAGDMTVWMEGIKMMKLTLPGDVEVVRE